MFFEKFTAGADKNGAYYAISEMMRDFDTDKSYADMMRYRISGNAADECDRLFVKAEEAAESDAVLQRIKREHLSIKYIKAVRIADSEERCRATDEFAAEARAFRLTEIMERLPLDDPLNI